MKNCFFNNCYCISQIHDLKPIIKRSFRQPAQSKRDSAFEQETRFVWSGEIWASSQNSFFSYNQSNKPTRAQKDIFGTYSTSFWKVCFAQETAVFISIRYHKTSQTQDVKSQSTKPSLRKMAQPKRDSAFEQKTHIVPSRETSGSSQNLFFSYSQRKKQSRAQTDIFGTYSTSFWKVDVFLSVRLPIVFRKVCAKIIITIAHNPKRRRPRFRKKIKSCFFKYSVSQDISNAGCKEPKYQT